MKAIRHICPRCSAEVVVIQNADNLHEYSEDTVFERCSMCRNKPKTPEEKLIDAIFGCECT